MPEIGLKRVLLIIILIGAFCFLSDRLFAGRILQQDMHVVNSILWFSDAASINGSRSSRMQIKLHDGRIVIANIIQCKAGQLTVYSSGIRIRIPTVLIANIDPGFPGLMANQCI